MNSIMQFSPPSLNDDSFFKPRFNVDCWISLDLSMLGTILNHLLDNEKIMSGFKNDINFRLDVLK